MNSIAIGAIVFVCTSEQGNAGIDRFGHFAGLTHLRRMWITMKYIG
jgi:hypothetical protein